jgi:hypothetical protein
MRRLIYFLTFLFFLPVYGADIFQDRGLKVNSCFKHMGKLWCEEKNTQCFLQIFSLSPQGLVLQVSNRSYNPKNSNLSLSQFKFKFIKKNEDVFAEILQESILTLAEATNPVPTMAQEVSCSTTP